MSGHAFKACHIIFLRTLKTLRRIRNVTPLLLAIACAMPAVAHAHGRLKSSLPAAGEHLGTVPRLLRLDFSEVPELQFSTLRLVGPGGIAIPLSALRYAPDSHRAYLADVLGALPAGTYTILWQMAGDDGHPVRDQIQFVIAPGAMGVGVMPANATSVYAMPGSSNRSVDSAMVMHDDPVTIPEGNGFDAESLAYVIIRWLQFTGLLIVIGAVAFRQLVLALLRRKQDPDSHMIADAEHGAARLADYAVWLLVLTAVLRLVAQAYAMHGTTGTFAREPMVGMILQTVWGKGWLLQLVGIAIAGYGLHRARTARNANSFWVIATVGAVILAFTTGFAGHAASAPKLLPLAIIADGLHVLGAGGWLGSLLMLLCAGIPAALRLPHEERGLMVAELVNAYSPTALTAAALIGVTGTFAAWLHVGTVPALWQTTYGRTLLLKLAILSIVALTGAYNWLKVKPTLGNVVGAQRIKRSARVEVIVGLAVLAVTAVLVATATSMDMKM